MKISLKVGILIFLFSFSTGASTSVLPQAYEVKILWSVFGEKPSVTNIVVKPGQLTMIQQDNSGRFLAVRASEMDPQGKKGIAMNFIVGASGRDGQKFVISKPSLATMEGSPSSIRESRPNGSEGMSLSVLVRRRH